MKGMAEYFEEKIRDISLSDNNLKKRNLKLLLLAEYFLDSRLDYFDPNLGDTSVGIRTHSYGVIVKKGDNFVNLINGVEIDFESLVDVVPFSSDIPVNDESIKQAFVDLEDRFDLVASEEIIWRGGDGISYKPLTYRVSKGRKEALKKQEKAQEESSNKKSTLLGRIFKK